MNDANLEESATFNIDELSAQLDIMTNVSLPAIDDELDRRNKKIVDLESMLEEKNKEILNLQSENNELYADLIKIENKESLPVPENSDSYSISEIKVESKKEVESQESLCSTVLENDCWEFPEILLEHEIFSLSELKKKKIKKKEIVHTFKVFILVFAHIMNADDPKGYNEFLDLRQGYIDGSLIQEVYLKWKAGEWEGEYIDKLYDSLVKIPQENRYTKLIEKFEKLIS